MDLAYEGTHLVCSWSGFVVNTDELDELADAVSERALDLAFSTAAESHLQSLAQTSFAAEWIGAFIKSATPTHVVDWQVGEAFAEAILERDHGVTFPWNTRRDERVPKASLPGADLVGLVSTEDGSPLVFGEVKSSSDGSAPPGVLVGKSGMIQQLERILDDPAVQLTLIKWLIARVPAGTLGEAFNEALGHFVNSEGAAVKLIGALIRDRPPNVADVSHRGKTLGEKAGAPGTVELLVWYLPLEMTAWTSLVAA